MMVPTVIGNGSSNLAPLMQDYVHSRILDFALEQSFARRLYTSPSRVYAAAKEALAELSRPVESSASGRDLRLVFRHTCQ